LQTSAKEKWQAVDPYKDSDGYAEVTAILGHRGSEKNREFQVQWADNSLEWVKYKDCDGCIDMIKLYCRTKRIVAPKDLKYKKGCGFVGSDDQLVEENWVPLDEIEAKAKAYGDKNALQAVQFTEPPRDDSIMLTQIGNHCFVLLYYRERRLLLVADGLNAYPQDAHSRNVASHQSSVVVSYLGTLRSRPNF
jgi:hypothetical protein